MLTMLSEYLTNLFIYLRLIDLINFNNVKYGIQVN